MSTVEQATDAQSNLRNAPAGADLRLPLPMDRIASFCRKWGIRELSVFGSILRDDFSPDSDVDFLAEFSPDCRHSLFDMVYLEDELREIVGRDVDVVVKRAVQQSRNPFRRREILGSARVVYHV
jgi:predicted nucleotidyltransferase